MSHTPESRKRVLALERRAMGEEHLANNASRDVRPKKAENHRRNAANLRHRAEMERKHSA